VVRFSLYAAVLGLTALLAPSAQAGSKHCCPCDCPPRHVVHHAAKAPAHVMHQDADADTIIHHDTDVEFAQSAYDYESESVVQEAAPQVQSYQQPWVEAPRDQSSYYYQTSPSYYAPAPAYGPPMGYGPPPAYGAGYGPDCDCNDMTGGVGYGAADNVFIDGYGETHYFSHSVAPQGGFSQGGFGRERFAPTHGFNFRGGLSNGY
jgi:hypothetical protein